MNLDKVKEFLKNLIQFDNLTQRKKILLDLLKVKYHLQIKV